MSKLEQFIAEFRPKGAESPVRRFLKWSNAVVGTIDGANAVVFLRPDYNEVVSLYTRGAKSWTPEQFVAFLSERAVNRDRRDIERILFRLGLSRLTAREATMNIGTLFPCVRSTKTTLRG
jgi:hypothetical protein